nr:lateral organ boundaries domain protein 11 [Ipomoea batatas]
MSSNPSTSSAAAGGGAGPGGGGGGGSSGGGGGGPCGACKFLRRKCVPGCIFAPYFDSEQGAAHFAAVHKVFGASNVSKLLLHIPVHKRLDAVITICYEAQSRLRDPVYGCVAHIFALQQQSTELSRFIAFTSHVGSSVGRRTWDFAPFVGKNSGASSTQAEKDACFIPYLRDLQVVNLQAELAYLQAHLATLEVPNAPPPAAQQSQPQPPLFVPPPVLNIADLPTGVPMMPATYDLSSLFDPMVQPAWAIQPRQLDPRQLFGAAAATRVDMTSSSSSAAVAAAEIFKNWRANSCTGMGLQRCRAQTLLRRRLCRRTPNETTAAAGGEIFRLIIK